MMLTMNELRDIATTRKRDSPLHFLTKLSIVLQQPLTDIARSYTDDGIFTSVVAGGTPEKFHADEPLFERLKIPSNRLLDYIN
jgi:hypothetical protein